MGHCMFVFLYRYFCGWNAHHRNENATITKPSSYPELQNLCTEAVIDRAMRTWISAH